jgi:hypothetical protein
MFHILDDRISISHSSGFFSNCSVSLHAIIQYYNEKKRLPSCVNFRNTFHKFKDRECQNDDVYPEYFMERDRPTITFYRTVDFPLYSLFDYREQSYSAIKPFLERYFSPSRAAIGKELKLKEKYNLQPDKIVTVCYRGTDKHHDTPIGSFETFLDATKRVLDKEPGLGILVQTDQQQFLDYARTQLGSVIAFEELPRTTTGTVMHNLITDRKIEWTQTFLGATHLIAQSRYLVLHTGNVARWMCLYRGHSERVLQYFHRRGKKAGDWIGEA